MKNLNFPGLPRILIIDDEEGVRDGLKALKLYDQVPASVWKKNW